MIDVRELISAFNAYRKKQPMQETTTKQKLDCLQSTAFSLKSRPVFVCKETARGLNKNHTPGHVLLSPVSPHAMESWFRNSGNFCFCNPESWSLEPKIQLKDSGVPLAIEI